MKIIFSRKGFDSGSGGCASPILPDGRLVSLPIPDGRSPTKYQDINDETSTLVSDLTRGRYRPFHPAHLDPDIREASLPRPPLWRGVFGQTGAASSHLKTMGVGPGDLFLFFGWFRDVVVRDGRYEFPKAGRNLHALFGWLQVAEVIDLSNGIHEASKSHPWLLQHPHMYRLNETGNRLYIAAEQLSVGGKIIGKGYGTFPTLKSDLVLSRAGASRSNWQLPQWMHPDTGTRLSYHTDAQRWGHGADCVELRTVGRGQEFVMDCFREDAMQDWLIRLMETSHA